MYKAAVIGRYDSIYGFASVGLDTYPVADHTEAESTLNKLCEEEYAVIYITEDMAAHLKKTIERYDGQIVPAIIQIPGVSGNTGAGILDVKKSVEKAVGSDILFGA